MIRAAWESPPDSAFSGPALTSFSLPNFHFHATTACNILRSKGVLVGKLDYMGALRLKV
ncbi:MAG: DUF1993 family protein [Methylocella sp.]